jgi:hypothetical protein
VPFMSVRMRWARGATFAAGVVQQNGFADAGEVLEQFPDGNAQAGAGGSAAHQVRDGKGEDAVEDVEADLLVGPGLHGAERHDVGVFELTEPELGVGLRPDRRHVPNRPC